ncbi:large ribosomal RNA subunit accumulation protein YCED homolog 2, chloroplastic [Cicer arietinum]|uniref:Large ribosomal RNA subunit accumulation protein YCED homolog 2, chloroplastic n=1 Tax=Cicer arietinum TaxID=3827 RepID=A0A1S2YJY3_CICAR|nr:large ribosomal RNA subunit accumulation protein YCED homolog 2, chloroplastic [Cicer arietinum]
MAKSGNLASQRSFIPIFNPCHSAFKVKAFRFLSQFHTYNNASVSVTITASTKRKANLHSPLIAKNMSRAARRLITISPADGKYHGDWTCDYLVSLRDLQLQDLIEVEDDPRKNAQVFIKLYIQKHASFGLSVDARITTSFMTKCSNCSSPYCRQIDAKFNVWVLRANREKRKMPLPEIGGDPYVIYVRPGYEIDLDSIVKDAIRLNSSVKDTCSELCEKSEDTILYTTGQSQASFDKRWSRLLELKKETL